VVDRERLSRFPAPAARDHQGGRIVRPAFALLAITGAAVRDHRSTVVGLCRPSYSQWSGQRVHRWRPHLCAIRLRAVRGACPDRRV